MVIIDRVSLLSGGCYRQGVIIISGACYRQGVIIISGGCYRQGGFFPGGYHRQSYSPVVIVEMVSLFSGDYIRQGVLILRYLL